MRFKIIHNFLSAEECDMLIQLARNKLTPSTTFEVHSGRSIINDYRQSEQMYFNIYENAMIKSIEERVSRLVGIPIQNGEGLQVVHYNPGGYYKPHWDYFDPQYLGNKAVVDRGGQRIATCLMYLNFVEQGGGTYFPRVPMNVQPEKGKAIFWFNINPENGTVDSSTYHEALPVITGEKWIMTKWLRAGMFR